MRYEIYWELTADGGARIVRVYGTTPEVALPERIEGVLVTEIGAYCFAAQAHLRGDYNRTQIEISETALESVGMKAASEKSGMRELAGEYPTRIVIPDTVRRLGNFAFYNAMSLRTLAIGRHLTEIGSDAFMNCQNLHFLPLRCGCGESSGLRQILAQISHDLEVSFVKEGGEWAKLLFPEYYESYDEIAPAHLFGRNIEGEGFRARQSFRDGVIDFAQYDAIFPKACVNERTETLCSLALNRLRYPMELGAASRQLYEEYLTEHAATLCELLAGEHDMELAEFLCRERIFGRADLERCIRYAAGQGWAEGNAYFLRLMETYFPVKQAARYTFEDF